MTDYAALNERLRAEILAITAIEPPIVDVWSRISPIIAATVNPSVEPYYLPMDCPICGRRRMEWDGKVLSCEKCNTSSEWDGFTKEHYATWDTEVRES